MLQLGLTERSVAFLFPGQGSQAVGMGAALAAAFPYVAELFAQADEALGFALSALCAAGPEAELTRTENTQPAILLCSVAAAAVVTREAGITPAVCAGHSLGEYSALVVAGSLALTDALRLVRLRGRFMQEAVPEGVGAMAAIVGMAAADLAQVAAEASAAGHGDGAACQIANDNGGGQLVLSGHKAAVERAIKLCQARGVRLCKLLPVSAPFHSALMAPAAERLRAELQAVALRAPRIPVIANWDAAPYPAGPQGPLGPQDLGEVEGAQAVRERLYQQVTGTVRWDQSMQALLGAGLRHAIEVGPGRVLTGLLKRIAPAVARYNVAEPAHLADLAPLRA